MASADGDLWWERFSKWESNEDTGRCELQVWSACHRRYGAQAYNGGVISVVLVFGGSLHGHYRGIRGDDQPEESIIGLMIDGKKREWRMQGELWEMGRM